MAAVSSGFLPVFSKQHSWTRNTRVQEILVLLCCFTLMSTTALHHQVLVDSDVLLFLTVCLHQEAATPPPLTLSHKSRASRQLDGDEAGLNVLDAEKSVKRVGLASLHPD